MNRIISEYEYKLLKILSESKEGLTEKELKDAAITDNGEGNEYHYVKSAFDSIYETIGKYKHPLITFGRVKVVDDRHQILLELTDAGKEAMEHYEWFINYKDEKLKTAKGNAFIIYEHKGGLFVTGLCHISYATVFGLTSDISYAKIFHREEEAKELIEEFWANSPCKYQNKESYEFSVEPVTVSARLMMPKTFVCSNCGKVHPIHRRAASTQCPNSWDTGLCLDCATAARIHRRESELGVYAYESFD